ncbi:MAG: glutamyl-tRNA reductase [Halobacteriaceae archaeon]
MHANTGIITSYRLSHHRATVDEIEEACFSDQQAAVTHLIDHPSVSEAYVLQTCHRVEAYIVTEDTDTGKDILKQTFLDTSPVVFGGHEESLKHLMRVAAGLESLIIGEDEILGQVSNAYEKAVEADAIGPILEEAIPKAIRLGERARSETKINEGVLSIGSAAVELASNQIDLSEATALIVGAGEMGQLCAEAFGRTDVDSLIVANRSLKRAQHAVSDLTVETTATDLNNLDRYLRRADLIVTTVDIDQPFLDTDAVADIGPTMIIDLGQPRNVSTPVDDISTISLFDLDDLEMMRDETAAQRKAAAESVEEMIDTELQQLLDQYKRKQADDVIQAMYEGAEQIKRRELQMAINKLENQEGTLTDQEREVIESLADTIVSQLLAPPTKSLREAAANDDWETISTALQLFNPELEYDDFPLTDQESSSSSEQGIEEG